MSLPLSSRSDIIVAEARTWVGTPYHHMGDVKGVGVDCGMLLLRIFSDLGILTGVDPRPYTRDWHMHRSEEVYLGYVMGVADELSQDEVVPGDIALFRVGRCYSHGAVVTSISPLTLVHALFDPGLVVEEQVRTNPQISKGLSSAKFFRVRDR